MDICDNDKLLNITEIELEIASLQSKIKLYEIRITRLKQSISKLKPTSCLSELSKFVHS
jgi:hypothetical protein